VVLSNFPFFWSREWSDNGPLLSFAPGEPSQNTAREIRSRQPTIRRRLDFPITAAAAKRPAAIKVACRLVHTHRLFSLFQRLQSPLASYPQKSSFCRTHSTGWAIKRLLPSLKIPPPLPSFLQLGIYSRRRRHRESYLPLIYA